MKNLFISHATEDKVDFVRSLAEALRERFDVWYDEYELVVGTSLLEEISKGLTATDYGVVVLSPHFFAKKWTQQELNGLFALEERDRKVILPIWKDVTQSDVRQHSPILADRVAVLASQGVEAVVAEIERSIAFFERGKAVQRGSGAIRRLHSALGRKAEATASDNSLRTKAGVDLVNHTGRQFVARAHETIEKLLRESPDCGIRIDTPRLHDCHSYVNFWSGRICLRFEYRNDVVNSATGARLVCFVIEGKFSILGNYEGANVMDKQEYVPFITSESSACWKDEDGNRHIADTLIEEWIGKYTDEIEEALG